MSISGVELAWLAGWLEGEGCFTLRYGGRRNPIIEITVNSTDYDVAQKGQRLMGARPIGKPRIKAHHKPIWKVRLSRKAQVLALSKALLPFMGERRSARINELIAAAEAFIAVTPQERGRRAGLISNLRWKNLPCKRCGCELPRIHRRGLLCGGCYNATCRESHAANRTERNARARKLYAERRPATSLISRDQDYGLHAGAKTD